MKPLKCAICGKILPQEDYDFAIISVVLSYGDGRKTFIPLKALLCTKHAKIKRMAIKIESCKKVDGYNIRLFKI